MFQLNKVNEFELTLVKFIFAERPPEVVLLCI